MKQTSRTQPAQRRFRYNDIMDSHQIEPELQRATPREVHCRDGWWGTIRPLWIFLLPHTWIAVAAPFFLLTFYVEALFPDKLPGTVTGQSSYYSKSVLHHQVKYRFMVDDTPHTGTHNISDNEQEAYPVGREVTVKVLKFLPDFNPQLEGSNGDWVVLPFATLWVTIWCGVMFPVMWMTIMPPLKSKHLCRIGKAVSGTVSNVETIYGSRGSATHCAHYSYSAPDRSTGRMSEVTFNKKYRFPRRMLGKVHQGQTVTILYDPDKPTNSIPYVLGDYAAG
jgi:hypothetical protein